MDGKVLARIAAAAFIGIAVAVTLLQLREKPQLSAPGAIVRVSDGDPLPEQLRTCSQMGEAALSSPECRAAWTENRRRFFDVDHPRAYSRIAGEPPAAELPGED